MLRHWLGSKGMSGRIARQTSRSRQMASMPGPSSGVHRRRMRRSVSIHSGKDIARSSQSGEGGRPSDPPPSVRAIVSAQPSEHRSGRPLRYRLFRKCLFGYRPHAVHEAIEARDVAIEARRAEAGSATRRIQELERVSARLATMVVDRDKELRRIRAELQDALERD